MSYIKKLPETAVYEQCYEVWLALEKGDQCIRLVDNGDWRTSYVNDVWTEWKCSTMEEAIEHALRYLGVPDSERPAAQKAIEKAVFRAYR